MLSATKGRFGSISFLNSQLPSAAIGQSRPESPDVAGRFSIAVYNGLQSSAGDSTGYTLGYHGLQTAFETRSRWLQGLNHVTHEGPVGTCANIQMAWICVPCAAESEPSPKAFSPCRKGAVGLEQGRYIARPSRVIGGRLARVREDVRSRQDLKCLLHASSNKLRMCGWRRKATHLPA